MSLIKKVREGQLSKTGFEKTLIGFEAEKIELVRSSSRYSPEVYTSKMNDLNMSISMVRLFLDKFDDLTKGVG